MWSETRKVMETACGSNLSENFKECDCLAKMPACIDFENQRVMHLHHTLLPLEPLSSLGMWPNGKDDGGGSNNSSKHIGLSTDQMLFN